jgi:hypothetical protein
MQHHWIVRIKETGGLAHLLQISASEGILDDDVDELLLDVVLLVAEGATKLNNSSRVNADVDGVLSSLDLWLENQIFLNLVESVDALAGANMGAKGTFEGRAFELHDTVHKVSIPHLHGLDIQSILEHFDGSANFEKILV